MFLRAYRALPRFKGDAAVGTWLYRIAVNVCLNKVGARASRRPSRSTSGTSLPSREPDAMSRLLSARAGRAACGRRLRGCRRRQRATLILRVYQELPHQEIARILGSSVGAVKANFFHALRNLRSGWCRTSQA